MYWTECVIVTIVVALRLYSRISFRTARSMKAEEKTEIPRFDAQTADIRFRSTFHQNPTRTDALPPSPDSGHPRI